MSEYIPRLQEAIASSIRGMGREDLLRRPEGKWSTAEVLEHLYLTYTGTVKSCERSLGSERPPVTLQTPKQRFKTLIVVTLGYFPSGIQSPRHVLPKGTPVEQVIADIVQQISAMDELLARCELRHGKRKKLFQSAQRRTGTPAQNVRARSRAHMNRELRLFISIHYVYLYIDGAA